jgi:hypothetical protein
MSQMLPEDMMSLIGGGGGFPAEAGAPPPPGGAIPPDMAAMMGGGAPPAPAPPLPEEPPTGALHGGSAAEGDPHEMVAMAIDLLEGAAKASPSDQDIQVYLQCATKLQGTLASAEKGLEGGDIKPALAAETSY